MAHQDHLTPEQIDEIVATIEGTSGIYDNIVCEKYGLTDLELYEILELEGYEKCSVCDWWVECYELEPMKDEDVSGCEDCRSSEA